SAVPEDELPSTVLEDESASAVSKDASERRASEWTLDYTDVTFVYLRSPVPDTGSQREDILLGFALTYISGAECRPEAGGHGVLDGQRS
ncbi:hypothetical protein Tco_1045991, partial [Tanacetum coccineum]